jgi:uncharacterized repeat protein (TIGR01451 family)
MYFLENLFDLKNSKIGVLYIEKFKSNRLFLITNNLTVVQRNYNLILVLGSILSVLICANTAGVVFGPSVVGQLQDDVTITKSLSNDKFGLGDSAIVTISIKSNSSSQIKNVSLTDIVPPMFIAEPKELFSNNVLIKQLTP